jgi:hypothetical protein
LSPDGEKTSPIDLETKSKQRKQNPKHWNKNTKVNNQKSLVRAADRLHNDVITNLGLYTPKPLSRIVSTKTGSNSTTGTKSILKRHRSNGGNKTRKL